MWPGGLEDRQKFTRVLLLPDLVACIPHALLSVCSLIWNC